MLVYRRLSCRLKNICSNNKDLDYCSLIKLCKTSLHLGKYLTIVGVDKSGRVVNLKYYEEDIPSCCRVILYFTLNGVDYVFTPYSERVLQLKHDVFSRLCIVNDVATKFYVFKGIIDCTSKDFELFLNDKGKIICCVPCF